MPPVAEGAATVRQGRRRRYSSYRHVSALWRSVPRSLFLHGEVVRKHRWGSELYGGAVLNVWIRTLRPTHFPAHSRMGGGSLNGLRQVVGRSTTIPLNFGEDLDLFRMAHMRAQVHRMGILATSHRPPLPSEPPSPHTIPPVAGYQAQVTDYNGLMSLAKAQGIGNETRGACRLCGGLGHLTKKCTNFLTGHNMASGTDEVTMGAGVSAGPGGTRVMGLLPEVGDLSDFDSSDLSSDSSGDSSDSEKKRKRKKEKSKKEKKVWGRSSCCRVLLTLECPCAVEGSGMRDDMLSWLVSSLFSQDKKHHKKHKKHKKEKKDRD